VDKHEKNFKIHITLNHKLSLFCSREKVLLFDEVANNKQKAKAAAPTSLFLLLQYAWYISTSDSIMTKMHNIIAPKIAGTTISIIK
jgi:hypothetical protein